MSIYDKGLRSIKGMQGMRTADEVADQKRSRKAVLDKIGVSTFAKPIVQAPTKREELLLQTKVIPAPVQKLNIKLEKQLARNEAWKKVKQNYLDDKAPYENLTTAEIMLAEDQGRMLAKQYDRNTNKDGLFQNIIPKLKAKGKIKKKPMSLDRYIDNVKNNDAATMKAIAEYNPNDPKYTKYNAVTGKFELNGKQGTLSDFIKPKKD